MIQISKHKEGFTLTELLIVILIIALLMGFLLPQLLKGPAQTRDLKRVADIERLATLMESYRNTKGELPDSGCIKAESTIGKALIELDLITEQNFPKDPSATNDVASSCKGGYLFTATRANGIEKNGFVIAAKMENKANGNFTNNGSAIPEVGGSTITLTKGSGMFYLKTSE